jgi:predicted nuclease with TOPRIM domain
VFGVKTHSIYNDKVDIASDPATSEAVGHELLPDDFDIDALRKDPKLYLIKTHGEPDVVKPEDKVIYLIRDGRESSLSYCKYINTYNDPNTTLNDVIDGNVPFGSWGRHVDMWQQSTTSETMFIRFETLVDTPQEYLPEISSFIGLPPLNNSIPTFEELQVINPKFFHKGLKDSWKDEYQPQEHLRFWIQNDSEMTEYGYKTHKPELFSDAALAERALLFTPDKKIITVTEIRQLQKSKNQSNALKGKLENTRDQVNDLRSKLESTRGQVDDLRGKLENTRSQRDSTQKSLTHKTATAVDLRGKLENTRGQRDATQERLTKKIAVVEGLLKNNQEITQRLNSFSHELSAKNRRITEIEKDYDLLKSPLKNLTSTSLLRNPVRKYRQYKQVLNAYQNGKIRSANRDLRKSQQTKKLKTVKAPLFSIITVTYNAEAFLNTTLKNILSQTFKDFELIIIDGNSSDQTLSIIRKYNSRIDYWVSEQDTGIYDAMNKGIAQASGDWINFMNAGDIFSSETTLEEVSKSIPKEADII